MKTVPAELVNCGTLVFGVRIVRSDATVVAWTQHDRDQTVTVDGEPTLLASNPGFTISNLVSAAGLSVDNAEIVVVTGDDLTRGDILARKWDGAAVFFFRYNWRLPGAGLIEVKRGSFGAFTPQLGGFRVEFRDLRQALQQNSTWSIQPACRWRLGDARCTVDLAPFTFDDVAVTSSANPYEVTATALVQAEDYFGEGLLTWTTGDNAGTPPFKVRSFAAGVVTLAEPAIYPIEAGDEFTIVAGCRGRWDADCRDKYSNVLNFGGEKDKPTRDDLISAGEADA